MLFDPKWNQPSVAGFKAWLEKQPRDRTFDFQNRDKCALGQYFSSIGQSCHKVLMNNDKLYFSLLKLVVHPVTYYGWRNATFGDVLAEIEKAGQ